MFSQVQPGFEIREWTLHEQIGRGAIGVVYRATHKFDARTYAIKILRRELAADEDSRIRFMREAQTAMMLRHSNVIETFLPFEEDDELYLPMEFLEGETLAARCDEHEGAWPIDVVADWIKQAAAGLGHAHDRGVLHRDISLANMFVAHDGHLKILDFGLAMATQSARVTHAGVLLGTPHYLAPERLVGKDASPQSDLYALGVVLFRLLTGCAPFSVNESRDVVQVFRQIYDLQRTTRPLPSMLRTNVPPELDALVEQLMAFDPKARPECAQYVSEALAPLSDEPITLDITRRPVSNAA